MRINKITSIEAALDNIQIQRELENKLTIFVGWETVWKNCKYLYDTQQLSRIGEKREGDNAWRYYYWQNES